MEKAKKEIAFEDALRELEDILQKMGKEETTLDESVAYYARAAELLRQCHVQLQDAQVKIEEISKSLPTEEPDAEQ